MGIIYYYFLNIYFHNVVQIIKIKGKEKTTIVGFLNGISVENESVVTQAG